MYYGANKNHANIIRNNKLECITYDRNNSKKYQRNLKTMFVVFFFVFLNHNIINFLFLF